MNAATTLRYAVWVSLAVAIVMGAYLANKSKATSYLSSEATACINCHVMESFYTTWMHSSHAQRATCVECHLPVENYIDKYASKARDGYNHSLAFTMNAYENSIRISDDGARRVQENCIRCHANLADPSAGVADRQHAFAYSSMDERKCWDCHRLVPHGGVRSISATPNSLGVRWAR